MKRIRFKPSLRQSLADNRAAERYLSTFAPAEKMAAAAERISELEAGIKPKRERAAPVQREAPVVSAVRALLARHPKVLWALRVNSGSASYEAKSGKWAPVKFHEWLRYPMPMRMPDFFGMMVDGRVFALEAKKPLWTKPVDQREREQADFLQCIRAHGGIGAFVRSVEEAQEAIENG